MFNVRMFANVRFFKCSNVRMFANIRMFACSMFECSLIFFLNPCSRVRMFAEHERTFEHWTQMFIVRWPLLINTFTFAKNKLIVIIEPAFNVQFFEFLVYLKMFLFSTTSTPSITGFIQLKHFREVNDTCEPRFSCTSVSGDVQEDKKLSPSTD